MLIEVLETTDHRFIGMRYPLPNIGDKLVFEEYNWDIVDIINHNDGTYTIVDPNYVALVREIKE